MIDRMKMLAVQRSGSWSQVGFISLSIVLVLFYLVGLASVPRSFGDEAWYAGPSVGMMTDGVMRNPVIDGRGGVEHFFLQPKVIPNLLALPVLSVLGISLASFRIAAVLAGFCGAIGTYLLGRMLFSERTGRIGSVLLLINVWFFLVARTYRPEVFVLALLVWFMVLLVSALTRYSRFKSFLAGAVGGACLLSHQIAWLLLPVMVTIVSVASVRLQRGGRHGQAWRPALAEAGRSMAWLILGGTLILLPYAAYVALAQATTPARFLEQLVGEAAASGHLSFYGYLNKEAMRWASFTVLPYGWPILCLYVAVLIHLWSRPDHAWHRPLVMVVLCSAVVFAVGVDLYTPRYLSLLLPFLALGIGRSYDVLVNTGSPINLSLGGRRYAIHERGKRLLASGAIALYCMFMGAVIGGTAYAFKDASYDGVCARIETLVKREDTIAGPIVFWLGLREHRYVVTNVAPTFSPGNYAWLTARLKGRKPDVVLETTTDLQSTDGTAPRPRTYDAVPYNKVIESVAQEVGYICDTVDSRDFGPIRVWRLSWPDTSTGVHVVRAGN